jgi:hypothetical protein
LIEFGVKQASQEIYSSGFKMISMGVNKGWLLFKTFINDIVNEINAEIKLFADDTSLCSTVYINNIVYLSSIMGMSSTYSFWN